MESQGKSYGGSKPSLRTESKECASKVVCQIGKMYLVFYLCELINKKESHVNTRLGTDHHQLIMPPISKDCSNTFLERSFIYAAPCEWNKLSEHIRTSNFDCFRKSVKTMLFTQQYGC